MGIGRRILSQEESVNTSFGMRDAHGREIGIAFARYVVEYYDHPKGNYAVEPGIYYCASFTTLRDGRAFGALTRDAKCSAPEDLEKEIARRIEGARKTATRKYRP